MWSLCFSHGVFQPGPSLSQTKYSYLSAQTRAARRSHYALSPLCHTDTKYQECVQSDKRGFLHPIILLCPQRQTRVPTPHHLIVSTATNVGSYTPSSYCVPQRHNLVSTDTNQLVCKVHTRVLTLLTYCVQPQRNKLCQQVQVVLRHVKCKCFVSFCV